jgi:hypothetical protein
MNYTSKRCWPEFSASGLNGTKFHSSWFGFVLLFPNCSLLMAARLDGFPGKALAGQIYYHHICLSVSLHPGHHIFEMNDCTLWNFL